MKLSVLLVTLLALSWAFAEDVKDDEKLSEQNDDDDLQAELGDEVAKIRIARAYKFSSRSNLQWQRFRGRIPRNAVNIKNNYANRVEYVCQAYCVQGFHLAKSGTCNYPYGNKEHRSKSFQLLINRDNFEILEWKWTSWGKVPKNAVKGCGRTYVGKNKYGLGKIDPPNKCFYLPWRGKEYWYRGYYALAVNMDVVSQKISHVKYNTHKMRVTRDRRPSTLRRASVKNYQCRTVTQTVSLTKSIATEDRWDVSTSTTLGVETTVSAGIPFIGSVDVTVGVEVSVSTNKGTSKVQSTEHSVSVAVTVPANHYCRVDMVAKKYNADIPFRAMMTRKYRNGRTTSTWIRGHYKKQQVGEIQAVVRRCRKLSGHNC